jgi:poly(A)-specific ribonuclease
MDVTRQSFQYQLPLILSAILDSHFVSFDLEFSGIASRKYGPGDGADRGKQTLQQRYEETKEAAERYQVLQIGLTCASEDVENG